MMNKLFYVSVVTGLLVAGCSKPEAIKPVAVHPVNSAPKVDASTDAVPPAPPLPGDPAAPAAPTPDASGTSELRPAATGPIVPGSPQDPNVMPAGFVPKPIPRDYVVNGQLDLKALSETLRDYCMWKKAVPQDLNELVTSKYLPSLPEPPAGKKFAINKSDLEVTLANK